MIREQRLLASRVGENRALAVPEDFLVVDPDTATGEQVLTALRGSIIQLSDAGYSEEESLRWLFTPEESLGTTPVNALREGRISTVRRAAQSLAF